nr:hypothetical protein [Paenibacillus sp. PL91]
MTCRCFTIIEIGVSKRRLGTEVEAPLIRLPFGEIFGVSGLFVADNSMIPTISAANPTLTTVALAIRTADHILQQRQA